jgi:hypothetical protein
MVAIELSLDAIVVLMTRQYYFLKVTSNWPARYTISPNNGIMKMGQTCTITVELICLGLV